MTYIVNAILECILFVCAQLKLGAIEVIDNKILVEECDSLESKHKKCNQKASPNSIG